MGEQGLDNLRLDDSPPGALPRLRNETLADSHSIYRAAVAVIGRVQAGLEKVSERGADGSRTLKSPSGAKIEYYDEYHDDETAVRGTRIVIVSLPFPGGKEEIKLEHQWSNVIGGSPGGEVSIAKLVYHGGKSYTERGIVYGSERADKSEVEPTRFYTGPTDTLTEDRSVIDPSFILGKIKKAFPQLTR